MASAGRGEEGGAGSGDDAATELRTLTVEAQAWLDAFHEKTRRKGEEYFRRGGISNLEPYKRGIGFRGRVPGSIGYYDCKVRLGLSGWEGFCTCPVERDCKHCYCLMKQALKELGLGSEAAAASAGGGSTAAGGGGARRGQGPPPAPSDETFQALLRLRLGRPLSPGDKRAAAAVDELFRMRSQSKMIAERELDPITGDYSAWHWNTVVVWPEPPRTPWEMWLYIAHYLRKNGKPFRPALHEATDWNEVDVFVASWDRREQVERWQERLNLLASGTRGDTGARIQLRARLNEKGVQLEWRRTRDAEFTAIKPAAFGQLLSESLAGRMPYDDQSLVVWRAFQTGYGAQPFHSHGSPDGARILNTLLRLPGFDEQVVGPAGTLFRRAPEMLVWQVEPARNESGDYRFQLAFADGTQPPPALALVDGRPSLYVSSDAIFLGPPLPGIDIQSDAFTIPAEAVETSDGIAFLDRLGIPPPARLGGRIRDVKLRVVVRCRLDNEGFGNREWLILTARAETSPGAVAEEYQADGWQATKHRSPATDAVVRIDRSALDPVPALIEAARVSWIAYEGCWRRIAGKGFPAQFADWLAIVPPNIELELDPLLASLTEAPVHARVKLEVEESQIDWFDLRVALDVADTTLTPDEIRLLLDARGGFVRLGAKGWRRLAFEMSTEDEEQLAELGLNARDFSSEPQRLHALQLAGKRAAGRLLPQAQTAVIERRAAEIQTRVAPPVPAELIAALRPYQLEGYHFLAYLTANHFGGILADDMGLGKTVQALAWLLWLRASAGPLRTEAEGTASSKTSKSRKATLAPPPPFLVVCPKSVMDNWSVEAARFAPVLRVRLLAKGTRDTAALIAARDEADVVVINYTQLRLLQGELTRRPWRAVVLDEAQAIKNPESQTARAALALAAPHRIALSGTPIENRLLDLWSIMAFAMPGILGRRADFARAFDQRSDPFARRRLAARVRPFVLRRTKSEVAKDLPERIEEDLHCELEGEQAKLYRAELKHARAALLNINTTTQLDKARFNILTSLLRLRQICCHPALINPKAAGTESAKLTALLDLLEPLTEEGHKVLVFSQFVGMIELIEREITARDWRYFKLTGATEDRGALVADFQKTSGAAIFLISLRAGGFGLNLTAASYVVLFDPWWNPAVENQAIDRTHRIGQTNKVIAYRLLMKESIEEKIRHLQKQKTALAADILGEENFARALTLDDFRFLLAE